MFADRKTSHETTVAARVTYRPAAAPSKTPAGVCAENDKPIPTCVLSSCGSWENEWLHPTRLT